MIKKIYKSGLCCRNVDINGNYYHGNIASWPIKSQDFTVLAIDVNLYATGPILCIQQINETTSYLLCEDFKCGSIESGCRAVKALVYHLLSEAYSLKYLSALLAELDNMNNYQLQTKLQVLYAF